jgi:hypothetical protein
MGQNIKMVPLFARLLTKANYPDITNVLNIHNLLSRWMWITFHPHTHNRSWITFIHTQKVIWYAIELEHECQLGEEMSSLEAGYVIQHPLVGPSTGNPLWLNCGWTTIDLPTLHLVTYHVLFLLPPEPTYAIGTTLVQGQLQHMPGN